MRSRRPLLVLLAGALTLLASLYLPWRSPSHGQGDILGWSADASYAAALIGVALALAAAAALLRPGLAARLPLGGLGVALACFTTAVGVQVRDIAFPFPLTPAPAGGTSFASGFGWTYGVYLGGAGGIMALLAAVALRRKELLGRPVPAEAAPVALGLVLLVSFLLPWEKAPGAPSGSAIGLTSPAIMIAAAGLILAGRWLPGARARVRLVVAAMVAVLTGAGANRIVESTHSHRLWGAWIGIVCAVALVALEAVRARALIRLPDAPPRWAALRSGAAALLVVALFLPWQSFGTGHLPPLVSDGWEASSGAAAGALALLLLAAPVLPWAASYMLEVALGIAFLVATFGIAVVQSAGYPDFHMRYGAYVGLVATALLLLAAFADVRWRSVDRARALPRTVPVVASLACVAAIAVPAWQGVLPLGWELKADALRSWFWVAALLLALHLLLLWLAQIGRAGAPKPGLVLTPLLILPLPALELVRDRSLGIVWGGVILIGLCLVLAALGWIEQDRGLENLRFPELLRLDRLPETES